MPFDRADELAPAIYDLALAWHLGTSTTCNTGFVQASGEWTNPVQGTVSSPYGMRLHPVTGVYKLHDGVDASAAAGTPVYTASGGVVTAGPSSWAGPDLVEIDHGGGVRTSYGHMSAASVKTGDVVQPGMQVGAVGTAGLSTGNHLHFSVWVNDETVDPVPFLAERGVRFGTGPVGSGSGTAVPVPAGSPTGIGGEVRLTQANLYFGLSPAAYARDLRKVVADRPDFVTLNEAYRRPDAQITPKGYQSFRASAPFDARETPVLWRDDKWTRVTAGTQLMHSRRVKWGTRYANWVTLKSGDQVVSVVSVHASPGGKGRHGLFKEYIGSLNKLVNRLRANGPVLVGGDLNVHYPSSKYLDKWLRASETVSSFGVLPEPAGGRATGDRGGVIDYLLASGATFLNPETSDLESDHRRLSAELTLDAESQPPTAGPFTGTSTSGETITLDADQVAYASGILTKGTELGVPDPGLIVALMTVAVESKFQMHASDVYPETLDLPHDAVGSNHDSVGLFQQRPQAGWGAPEELMEVDYSASAFFGGTDGPNGGSPRGLLD
ncbi:MAG: peptidoglycan DD-metalloendopeptidase family protein, partial [Phycicoccus sp.]